MLSIMGAANDRLERKVSFTLINSGVGLLPLVPLNRGTFISPERVVNIHASVVNAQV